MDMGRSWYFRSSQGLARLSAQPPAGLARDWLATGPQLAKSPGRGRQFEISMLRLSIGSMALRQLQMARA
jgi:hypothetical protein